MVLLKTMATTKIFCFGLWHSNYTCYSIFPLYCTVYNVHILRMFTDSVACAGLGVGAGGGRQKVPHTLPSPFCQGGKGVHSFHL